MLTEAVEHDDVPAPHQRTQRALVPTAQDPAESAAAGRWADRSGHLAPVEGVYDPLSQVQAVGLHPQG